MGYCYKIQGPVAINGQVPCFESRAERPKDETINWRLGFYPVNTIIKKLIQNCILKISECAERVRSSNLQLPSARKTCVHKRKVFYQMYVPARLFAGWLLLRKSGK
jgi:hypothetical protein